MAQIYATAEQVIMWVGEDSPEGDGRVFVEWWRKATSIRKSSWSTKLRELAHFFLEQSSLHIRSVWVISQYLNYPVFHWRASRQHDRMRRFSERRYLSRRWCVQETASARQVLLVCGAHQVSLAEIYGGTDHIPPSVQLRMPRSSFADVLEIMVRCSHLQCLDERDCIYALASLIQKNEDFPTITIDYTLPWTKVFVDFARELVLTGPLYETWRVLYMAGAQQRGESRRFGELPSWVPDWRLPLLDDGVWKAFAKEEVSTTNDRAKVDSDGTLSLRFAFYGSMGAAVLGDGVIGKYRVEDRLYGPHPGQMVEYLAGLLRYEERFLVLRSCGEGKEKMCLRIVGVLSPQEQVDCPGLVEMHDIFIQ